MDEETEKHIEKLERQINDLYYHAQELSEKLKSQRKYNVAKDFAINDILTKDEPKHEDNKRQYNRGEYIYRGGNDDVVRKAGCDKHKFEKWLADCPVTIYKREDCAYGWVEMHFIIDDEKEED